MELVHHFPDRSLLNVQLFVFDFINVILKKFSSSTLLVFCVFLYGKGCRLCCPIAIILQDSFFLFLDDTLNAMIFIETTTIAILASRTIVA